ncbi:hypothetical protein PSACC_03632 [Paramicrosporidium saccamoebae]|uniref:C-type lectin domain-containing protein n=1 Tax=Paramicrosporidium saccamoebae TaxID=1246581 RepID=A0A2H9TFW0_9FUNG|nr:hypothetical protein PSACC_03632 [Paramicrosporidium saccamoebae]
MLFRLVSLAALLLAVTAESQEWCPAGGCWIKPKGECEGPCDRLCGNPDGDLFVVARAEAFGSSDELCHKYGGVLANINSANFEEAALTAFRCSGPHSETWVRSWNTDDYGGACLVLSTATAPGGGSINVPISCHKRLYTMCSRRQPKVHHPCRKPEPPCSECPKPVLFDYRGDRLPTIGPKCQFSYVRYRGHVMDEGEVSIWRDQLVIRPGRFGRDFPILAAAEGAETHEVVDRPDSFLDGNYLLVENSSHRVPSRGSLTFTADVQNIGSRVQCRRRSSSSSSSSEDPKSAIVADKEDGPAQGNPFWDLSGGFFVYAITDPDSGFTVLLLAARRRIYLVDDGLVPCSDFDHNESHDWLIPTVLAQAIQDSTDIDNSNYHLLDLLVDPVTPTKSALGGKGPGAPGPKLLPIADTPRHQFNLAMIVDAADKSVKLMLNDREIFRICGHKKYCHDKFPAEFKFFFGLHSLPQRFMSSQDSGLVLAQAEAEQRGPRWQFIPAVSNVKVLCCDGCKSPHDKPCHDDKPCHCEEPKPCYEEPKPCCPEPKPCCPELPKPCCPEPPKPCCQEAPKPCCHHHHRGPHYDGRIRSSL